MTMQKPARKLAPVEIFVCDIARKTERLRDRTADFLAAHAQPEHAVRLKGMIDHFDATLNEAATLQRFLGDESRKQAAGKH